MILIGFKLNFYSAFVVIVPKRDIQTKMASRLGSKPFMNTSKDMKSAIEAKCREILTTALALEENRYCFDCGSKGPRWASWNLGVFLCIRCAGFHRKMGVHISKVKSVDLDSWTPDQVRNSY